MDINEKIRSNILEAYQNDLSYEETEVALNRILGLGEWEEVRNGLLNILYGNDQTLWYDVIRYIYYLQGRGYTFEDAKTIAILYNCLTLSEGLDGNLIWTITKGIKLIPYLSEYEPFHDPAVLNEMDKIAKIRNGEPQ